MTEGEAEGLGSADPIMRTGPPMVRGQASLGLAFGDMFTQNHADGCPMSLRDAERAPRLELLLNHALGPFMMLRDIVLNTHSPLQAQAPAGGQIWRETAADRAPSLFKWKG